MPAKNLGQVSGLYIGSTPPSNVTLIWYDDTPAVRRHKVYDVATSQWIVLEKSIITSITYSELTTKAQNTGLSVGEYFMITDKANALALAITRTKVQYTDLQGNILVDDLGTSISYHVTSTNLLIDDVAGVFDETNSTLVFSFNETTPTEDDYILAKGQRQSGDSSVWQFLKFKISQFISSVSGNSLKWNGGLFINVRKEVEDMADQPTGFVSMQTYEQDMGELQQSVENVGKTNQEIVENVNQSITNATTASQIYSKQLPTAPTSATATDIVKGDTLTTIVNKIQRWITQFKVATGIKVSSDFAANGSDLNINNNDTVDSALRKVQGNMENYRKGLEDFQTEWDEYKEITDEEVDNANARQGDVILVSSGTTTDAIPTVEVTEASHDITFGDTLKTALGKLLYMCTQIQNWQIKDETIRFSKLYSTVTHSHTHFVIVNIDSGAATSQTYVDLSHFKVGVAIGKVSAKTKFLVHREITYTDNFVIDNQIGQDDCCIVLPQSPASYTRSGWKNPERSPYSGVVVAPFKVPRKIGTGFLVVQVLLSFDSSISGNIDFSAVVRRGAGSGNAFTMNYARINGKTTNISNGNTLISSTSVSDDNFNISLEMYFTGSVIDAAYPENSVDMNNLSNMEIDLSLSKLFS